AEEAEASLAAAFATGGEGDTESAGVVRIAAVPMITAHVLAPSLRLLNELAPGVVVELIAVPETQALTWRDADNALRPARSRARGHAPLLGAAHCPARLWCRGPARDHLHGAARPAALDRLRRDGRR